MTRRHAGPAQLQDADLLALLESRMGDSVSVRTQFGPSQLGVLALYHVPTE